MVPVALPLVVVPLLEVVQLLVAAVQDSVTRGD